MTNSSNLLHLREFEFDRRRASEDRDRDLHARAAFVDFYTMPRTYSDDQYLAGALGMYLTYINLFIFILRLVIALNGGGDRRD
jgi:hypothetical protein